MSSQPPVDLGLSISIAIFVLSFSWLFAQRTDQYPHLRRLSAVFSDGFIPSWSQPQFRVTVWGFLHILFWLVAASLSFFGYAIILEPTRIITLSSLLVGPVFYFLAPQAISATTTMLILWKVPNDPAVEEYESLDPYREGNRARNFFIFGFFASFLFLFGPLIIFSIVSLIT